MEDQFWQEVQQYAAEVGHAPTTAECYRLIDEIEDEMEIGYEDD